MRLHERNVKRLHTARMIIELGENQAFYSTPKAWEIWEIDALLRPIRLIKRLSKDRVIWVGYRGDGEDKR